MFLTPVFIIVIWQIYSSKGLINVSVLPSPSIIFSTILDLIKSGDLFRDLGISLLRVIKRICIWLHTWYNIGNIVRLK